MGHSRPKHSKKQRSKHRDSPSSAPTSPASLLAQSALLLSQGDPVSALPLAQKASSLLSPSDSHTTETLSALSILGEINIELGNPDAAREAFMAAAKIDPEGSVPEAAGGGAEKFLWLAQLSEQGGRESLGWYERGVEALTGRIQEGEGEGKSGREEEVEEGKRKVAGALCAMVEVWMTDLSLEDEAEAQCESLITRALMVSSVPYASTLQTLASIRLSQNRLEDAESALTRSVELWKDLPLEDPDRPDFPTRISLTRLLMEAEMEELALEVVEVLVGEDDESVEAWYLGGWCLHLMASKVEEEKEGDNKEQLALLLSSREWLRNCLKLYGLLDYEDDRLRDHAQELVAEMDKELGEAEIEEDGDEEGWEDEEGDNTSSSGDEDHEMEGT
ncbi:MAG: hypothetical protein MMC23_003871 [Stictis urceolatum]|nr:hypothetical protein [Stictis urceolata]